MRAQIVDSRIPDIMVVVWRIVDSVSIVEGNFASSGTRQLRAPIEARILKDFFPFLSKDWSRATVPFLSFGFYVGLVIY